MAIPTSVKIGHGAVVQLFYKKFFLLIIIYIAKKLRFKRLEVVWRISW